jgi:hypothetical protein
VAVVAFLIMASLLRLPQRIKRGEEGQAAIQMLDAMRRPFLEIKQTEARLIQTSDAETGYRDLAIAIDSAGDFLSRYQELAQYSAPLRQNVADLSDTFRDWITVEHRFFNCARVNSAAGVAASCLPDVGSAQDGFLRTMNTLGAGETPIHLDIEDGRRASRILQASVGVVILYLTVLGFWAQRARSKIESALLREHLRAEQRARAVEKALSEALEKVLSGFISICANCKRVRVQENEWTPIDAYITGKTDAKFSHGICPVCMQQLYGDFLSSKTKLSE